MPLSSLSTTGPPLSPWHESVSGAAAQNIALSMISLDGYWPQPVSTKMVAALRRALGTPPDEVVPQPATVRA